MEISIPLIITFIAVVAYIWYVAKGRMTQDWDQYPSLNDTPEQQVDKMETVRRSVQRGPNGYIVKEVKKSPTSGQLFLRSYKLGEKNGR